MVLWLSLTHRSLAKRAYCLRVKTFLKSRGSSPHGPVSASRRKGLEEVVGWRCSPTKVRVDGVLVDVEGFSHPRHSAPPSRPQVPPKPNVPDRQSKAERNLVLSKQYSALSDDEMESSSIL